MDNLNYSQILPMTYEEKVKMYLKCKKIELAKMLATRDEISKIIPIPAMDKSIRQCTSWKDCVNPCRDCINCPLRGHETLNNITTTSATTETK